MNREQRKLAAILAADVVGYSRLMGRDESGTLARLRQHRKQRFEPALARHGGRLVKLTGDGLLAEFPSAVDALGAAIEFQQAMAVANQEQPADTRIVFRIGLHLGDLIVDADDLYGDGVNVAARLEGEAPAGGIVISRTVHEAVEGRLKATFEDLGSLALKNIERPIQAFRVQWKPEHWHTSTASAGAALALNGQPAALPLTLPDKPSIAVLPFQNMSGDPEQEYFADGMVEDIITGLSRTKSLFVIARNSSFSYKGRSPDVRQVGRDLGVRYVLEGSVRKAGNRLRITGQLIEATSGVHLWADRIEGDLANIFDFQDQVTSRVVGALLPALEQAEIIRAKRKVGSLQAYDYYLRGLSPFYALTEERVREALQFFDMAVSLDPELALAYAGKAGCYIAFKSFGWDSHSPQNLVAVEDDARKAIALDRNDARVLAYAGQALGFVVGHRDEGLGYLDEAVSLDPNLAIGWTWRAGTKNCFGEADGALKDLERALRLSPLDPLIFITQGQVAKSHFILGHYEDAVSWASASLRQRPTHLTALRVLMAAQAMAGRPDAAREALRRYRTVDPTGTLGKVRDSFGFRREEDAGHFEQALHLAGLRE